MFKTVFDTAPLITCCKFEIQGKPIVDYILDNCNIIIPSTVRTELTIEKEVYADAVVAEARIKAERIEVRDVELPADNVLDYYGLGSGEKEAIVLSRALEDEIDFLVIDDKLGYIVCDRLEIRKAFFLDLVLKLLEGKQIAPELVRQIVNAVRPRYSDGLIRHTLRILEGGDRRCLW